MKILIGVLAVLLGAAVYMTMTGTSSTPEAAPQQTESNVPLWQQPIPEGTKLVESGLAKINVKPVRRNEGDRCVMDFHVTEEHGYMVDGITVKFWYKFKDAESGDVIEDPHTINYYIKGRLGFNETLVESTPLLDLEFNHLNFDEVRASTGDNWGTSVVKYARAMEPDRD